MTLAIYSEVDMGSDVKSW